MNKIEGLAAGWVFCPDGFGLWNGSNLNGVDPLLSQHV